jgi:hypothetical protein
VIQTLTLVKGRHLHVIRYETGDESAVLDAVAVMVQNKALDFDWFDAALVAHQIGLQLAKELMAHKLTAAGR